MLYIIFSLAVLSLGFVTIICCMFSSMLSREEERKMKVDYGSNYSQEIDYEKAFADTRKVVIS
jgi:protein-S-isoprenylcysteine O-methyltransferase Ste14